MFKLVQQRILSPLQDAGYCAYMVGGCVRSLQFDETPHDIDIVTNAPENIIFTLFPGASDVSKNMSLKVYIISVGGQKFEVANFRSNSSDSSTGLEIDIFNRDFTMNALLMDSDSTIIDYVNGLADIENRKLRAIGNPDTIFIADPIRIIRGVRFKVQYDLTIDSNTLNSMRNNRKLLYDVPPERIMAELYKIMSLGGKKFADALILMHTLGILEIILPEIAILDNFKHSEKHHPEGNPFQHVISAVRYCKSTDPDILLAVLFHDCGKAVTYKWRQKADGTYTHSYHGHDIAGVNIIADISKRLKLSTKTSEIAKFCAAKHMLCHKLSEMKAHKILTLIEHPYFYYLMEVSACDEGCRGSISEETIKRQQFVDNFIKNIMYYTDKITGKLVLELTNIEPGPLVGLIIFNTKKWICNTKIVDSDKINQYIIMIAKSLSKSVTKENE